MKFVPDSKWQSSAITFAILSLCVFLINLVVLVVAESRGGPKTDDGSLILRSGHSVSECNYIEKLDTVAHLIINLLSTVLLGGSNYCMQCLSAATRRDVDQAHCRGHWLDIGVPSFRNLRHIGWTRFLLWSALGLSSIPLHLLY